MKKLNFAYARTLIVVVNEIIIFGIISTYNFGGELGFGLVVQFSSALIISQLSSFMAYTGRIKKLLTYYN